jgi:RHS repeat-associated protein
VLFGSFACSERGASSREQASPRAVGAVRSALSSDLVAAYSFDEGTGTTLNDLTANGNNGVLSGQTWSTGKYRTGLVFDGQSYITVPDSPSLDLTTNMTISAWVRPFATATEWPAIALKEAQGDLSYALYSEWSGSAPSLCLGPPSDQYGTCVSGGAASQDNWTHLAGTYDGSVYRMYANGELVASGPQTMAAGVSTGALRIGGDAIWGEYFTGIIDELRIYDRALSQSEIQTDMAKPVNDTGPDTTPPSVSITSPANGSKVAGPVEIDATVSDDIEVSDAKFFVDGALIGEKNWAPYVTRWDSTQATPGSHVLTVTAIDEAGNSTTATATVTVVPNALVAAYSFDDASGTTLHDVSGNGNDGVLTGQTWSTGKYRTGLIFDGQSYITVPNSPLLDLTTGMTLSAWIRPLASAQWFPTIALKEDQGDLSYSLYSEAAHSGASLCVGPPSDQFGTCVSGGSVPQDDWTHLAGTYDGSVYNLYMNGELVASAPQTMAAGVSTDPLRIGGNSIWNEYFTGIIDELRIYARPLSQAEIQSDMATPVHDTGPDTTPPVVSIAAPTDGAKVAGPVDIRAQVSDDIEVADVKFLVDGSVVGEGNWAPFVAHWDSTTVAAGPHAIRVQATDEAGNTTSSSMTVTVVPNALVAAYNFDEGSGTALHDVTGNGNDTTLSGQAFAAGKYGTGLSFDGTSYVTIADSSLLDLTTGMTLSAWVRPLATAQWWPTIALKEDHGDLSYSLYSQAEHSPASLCLGPPSDQYGTCISGGPVPQNDWTHLAGTYDGSVYSFYINGVLVASAPQTMAAGVSTGPLRIGGNSIWNEYFTGIIDDLRVYARPLTQSEIVADMSTPLGSGCDSGVDDGNPCTTDACTGGVVTHTPVAAGTSCSDGNACNGLETCNAAATCVSGTPPVVDDGNPCTVDACNAGTGVSHTPVTVGTSCGAAPDACHSAPTCDASATCQPATPLSAGTTCGAPVDACHSAPACNASGTCQPGANLPTDDGNPCTTDSCNPSTGVSHVLVSAGTTCAAAPDACHGASTCTASGSCQAGSVLPVDDGNPCTADNCDPATGVQHSPIAAGASCSDGNACNGAEACNGSGACAAGTPPTVDDGNPCTTDSCDAVSGVSHTPITAGASCSDGNACNGAETCNAIGFCQAGTAPSLDDGNPCTADGCNPSSGPTHLPVSAGTSCSDANVCNGSEICNGASTCQPGQALTVDDGNPCTADTCDPTSGVSHTPLATGSACGIAPDACHGAPACDASGACQAAAALAPGTTCAAASDACHSASTCSATGVCQAGGAVSIDDGNPCTSDSCDGAAGPTHTPVAAGTSCGPSSTCDGAGDCVTTSVPDPATVAPPTDLTAPQSLLDRTSFIFSGSNPIQSGVTAGTIKARQASLLRGRVVDRDGQPLEGIAVEIQDHPELGSTRTRTDGHYDLVVNGGNNLVLRFSSSGYLTVNRGVVPPWNDALVLDDVAMVQVDPSVTAVVSSSSQAQVVAGSQVTDADGTRRAVVIFQPGTTAEMMMPDGSVQPLDTLNVHVTEYTKGPLGPSCMPGELPPSSGYTYAVELTAEEAVAAGATTVQFNQPASVYVDDFLGFPVGTIVPAGTYERGQACWKAQDNGRVVQILSVTQGLAVLDVDGSGSAASASALSGLGITDAERGKLAETYSPGAKLWRVPMLHWSSLDCNWPAVPDDPDPPDPPQPPQDDDNDGNPPEECHSIIEATNQTLGEEVHVAGTPFELSYRSDRVPGRQRNRIQIPISGANVGSKTIRFELQIELAGRTFDQTFPAAPNQSYTFIWDGLDAYGRPLAGRQAALVRVGRVVPASYTEPNQANAFAQASAGGTILTADKARNEFTIWQEHHLSVGNIDARQQDIAGWTLDAHHQYDLGARTLYLGNGNRHQVGAQEQIIERLAGKEYLAGQPPARSFTDGSPALNVSFGGANSLVVEADGSVLIGSQWVQCTSFCDGNGHVDRWDPETKTVTNIAGSDSCNDTVGRGDGGPAKGACITPVALALAKNGDLLIGESNSVRRVSSDGTITTVAGHRPTASGTSCTSAGDGGQATSATLCNVQAVSSGNDCSIYILEGDAAFTNHGRLRQIGPDGIIRTLVSNVGSIVSFTGGIDVGSDGAVYVADTLRHTVNKLSPQGKYSVIAGTLNQSGFSGDGGTALLAKFNRPMDITAAPDGTIFVTDTNNCAVRTIDQSGIMHTLVGSPTVCRPPPTGMGGPVGDALVGPGVVSALGPDSSLYLIDSTLSLRRIRALLPFGVPDGAFKVPSAGGREVYEFDARGRHLRTLHGLTGGTLFTFGYDAQGHLSSVTDGDGNVTSIQRDAAGNPTSITSSDGLVTVLETDANGFLSKMRDPASEETSFTYTPDGLMTSMTDVRGGLHQFDWDPDGRILRDQSAAGGFSSYARSVATNSFLVTRTTALGAIATYKTEALQSGQERRTFAVDDGLPRVTLIDFNKQTADETEPDGLHRTTTLGGDVRWAMTAPIVASEKTNTPSGTSITDTTTQTSSPLLILDPFSFTSLTTTNAVNGLSSTEQFVAQTAQMIETTAAGRSATTTVDVLGRPVSVAVPGMAPVAFTYDAHGRLQNVTQGTRVTTNVYDSTGNLRTITDALMQTETLDHDAVGRVTARHRADGSVVSYGYDAAGNLISLTPPGKPPHLLTYDPDNRIASYTAPDVGSGADVTGYAYDLDGHPTTVTRPDGSTVTLGYDSSGRTQSVTLPGGSMTFGYDATTGKLTSVSGPYAANLAYAYDGNLLTSTTWSGGVSGSVMRTYDNFFRVATETVNGQAATKATLGYDNDGLVTSVATPAGSMSLTYDPTAPRLQTTTLGSVTDTRTYDQFGQVATYTANFGTTVLYDVSYVRDALGRIQQKTETIQGTTTVTQYGYDQVGRLVTVTENGVMVRQYTYDDNGNRTRFDDVEHGTGRSGTYDAQDRLLSYGPLSYTYTRDGALHTKTDSSNGQTTTYTYDALGNLTHVDLPDGRAIDYVIDGMGRRVGKKINGVLQKQWLYADDLRVVAELDGSGNVVSRFVWADGTGSQESSVQAVFSRLGVRLPDVLGELLRDLGPRWPLSAPAYMTSGGALYRVVADQLGTPRLSVNVSNGAIGERLDLDEWGKVTADSSAGFSPFGFAAGLRDVDTELSRFGSRDYEPETGRWLAKDPSRFSGGETNLYGYAGRDSVNRSDPAGYGMDSPKCQKCLKDNADELERCRHQNACDKIVGNDGHDGCSPASGSGSGTNKCEDCEAIARSGVVKCLGNECQ